MNAQKLADFICKQEGIKNVNVHVKKINGGRARFATRFISIPKWAENTHKTYFFYYVVHEVSHFIAHSRGHHCHDNGFKAIETALLGQFGITVTYAKAYAKELYLKGKLVYKRGENASINLIKK